MNLVGSLLVLVFVLVSPVIIVWLTCITCREQIISPDSQNQPFEAKDKPRENPPAEHGYNLLIAQSGHCRCWKPLHNLVRANSMVPWVDKFERWRWKKFKADGSSIVRLVKGLEEHHSREHPCNWHDRQDLFREILGIPVLLLSGAHFLNYISSLSNRNCPCLNWWSSGCGFATILEYSGIIASLITLDRMQLAMCSRVVPAYPGCVVKSTNDSPQFILVPGLGGPAAIQGFRLSRRNCWMVCKLPSWVLCIMVVSSWGGDPTCLLWDLGFHFLSQ